ncbi:hypothetical protein E2C01_062110 [Portunus trituberculatus]|uniref:Uncharacterized protein n=1 Tax=Portunus trituberculatus TaxID=210409 RepID=A0A5B7HCQ9_PORTR|nr:hypothetical protein [Portunus trituberculatus]
MDALRTRVVFASYGRFPGKRRECGGPPAGRRGVPGGECACGRCGRRRPVRVAVGPEVDASLPRPPPPPLLLVRRLAAPAPPGGRSCPAGRSVTAPAAAIRACHVINRDKN